jgi:glutathione S-transferase
MTMNSTTDTPLSLLTFAPMIDSELGRWILTHYGVPYREDPHVFGFAWIYSLWYGKTLFLPVLYGDGPCIATARALVDHFEPTCPIGKKLMPADSFLAAQVNADTTRFNGTLGAATAVLGYSYLLPERSIMIEPFSRGVPSFEAKALPVIYPALAGLFKLLLKLTPANVADALTETRALFAETDKRLADGRQYLVGDRLTLSDLALATAAAPLLLPEHYGSPMPPFASMPAALQAIITELRRHETARFVDRIYRDHRLAG